MTTELQKKLSAIKAECQRAIERGEKATPGPWIVTPCGYRVFAKNSPDRMVPAICATNNRSRTSQAGLDTEFIAHSRTFSPAAAKGLLMMIEEAERCLAHHPMDIDDDHHAAVRILQSLADSFDETKARG